MFIHCLIPGQTIHDDEEGGDAENEGEKMEGKKFWELYDDSRI